MLGTGIIRPSNSPYSSSVILVKKRDGSWRFYIDYRVFKKTIIPNKFHIPVIEELLMSYKDPVFFSKGNLRVGYRSGTRFEFFFE
ncbi:hypothetical protein VIGAN_08211500 [Vigna angularis var. angularis]|uniref:Reverse transcriptase domain-containing protein n=1 Tax=Vigna angularis var. angularis TaxID=157739 RepID=A0A0S3SRF8_PHAAN|nr:hypothetical protein VIGAN_08211500 [Vigna angularis var. angularis]